MAVRPFVVEDITPARACSRASLSMRLTGCGMTPTIDLPNGYYMVPVGKLVNAVTWLEMLARPASGPPAPLRLMPVTDANQEACLSLFAAIGRQWLWSRAFNLSPPELSQL